MKKRSLEYIALFLICILLSACGAAQSVLDSALVQAVVNLKSTQTAQVSAVADNRTPEPRNINKIPTPAPRSASSTENILFGDDFSDPNSGWDESSDSISSNGYVDVGYSIMLDEADYCSWTTVYHTFSDLSVKVDAQKISGSGYDEYGVVCRLKDNSNHYYLGITSDGF
jgi:hypothetical protein